MQVQNVPAKKSFRVDELAKELGVKKFIIKNWEKQFDLKKCGLDHKYSQEDFKIFATIKNLVFIKKMPQSLAKKHLQEILSGKEIPSFKQELSDQITENPTSQEIQALEAQDIAAQDIAEIASLEREIQEMTTQTLPDQAIATQNLSDQDLETEARIQAFITKGLSTALLSSETETTFQAAHEEEIIAAQSTDEIADIRPALQEKEVFIKNLQSFKEQLLRIHEQLK